MLECPIPIADYPEVTLAHGGGGTLTDKLIETLFVAAFDNEFLRQRHDGTQLPNAQFDWAMSTDSFVVTPWQFPGGDIGKLAVCGTLNDLASCGARPLYLSLAFILEEGFAMADLWHVVQSIAKEARAAGVSIVTGDTKVVERGKGDGIFINTTGLGAVEIKPGLTPSRIRNQDQIIVTGDLGRHGMTIMAQREGLNFDSDLKSDSANLWPLIELALLEGIDLHCARDLTRGGLVSATNEIAQLLTTNIQLQEAAVPISESVRGGCELLGLDPMYVACEGRMLMFVSKSQAEQCLDLLHSHPLGAGARIIGEVGNKGVAEVTLVTSLGSERYLDKFVGEQLPRIC